MRVRKLSNARVWGADNLWSELRSTVAGVGDKAHGVQSPEPVFRGHSANAVP